jgi:hypothetical protein
VTFAEDFAADYQELDVIRTLRSAILVLQCRPAMADDVAYGREAAPVRQKCEAMATSTRFNTYPAEWLRVVAQSRFNQYLPARVAKIVLSALPPHMNTQPHSGELGMYESECSAALALAQQFIPFTRGFSLERVVVPEGELGVLITLPRHTFGNEVSDFCVSWANFQVLLLSSLRSLATRGSRRGCCMWRRLIPLRCFRRLSK